MQPAKAVSCYHEAIRLGEDESDCLKKIKLLEQSRNESVLTSESPTKISIEFQAIKTIK